MNSVQLCGRLTRDPELRQVGQNQTWLAKLGLAVDTPTGRESETTFLDVTAWGSVAERCDGLHKGDAVFVGGKLRTEAWDDKQTGQKRSKLTIVAELVGPVLLRHESQRSSSPRQPMPESPPEPVGVAGQFEDSIPF